MTMITGFNSNFISLVPFEGPEPRDDLMVAIVAISAVGVVMVALGVLVTHVFTKRFIKKKMPSLTSQPTDISISVSSIV